MKITFLSGAGISAESGLSTFRGQGGLWEGYDVREVASIEAWQVNQELVLDFYNMRRRQLKEVEPNKAHTLIASLQDKFDVQVVTQNVDNLHERGGAENIIHLHGLLTEAKSSIDESYVIDIGYEDIKLGDLCPSGYQMRPNIVWFGEMVPMLGVASEIVSESDVLVIVGTSLEVYPAASLIDFAPARTKVYLIDPEPPKVWRPNVEVIAKGAGEGMEELVGLFDK